MGGRIIVGVDGSGPSQSALRWAARRAKVTGSELTIEYVVDADWGQMGEAFARQGSADGERLLAAAMTAVGPIDCTVNVELAHGNPALTLASDSKPGDLIVVGTHKTGFIRGRVLGTRSIAVASVAPCSVVVVPEDTVSHRRGIVVGVDGGDRGDVAVVAGAIEAQFTGEDLTLVHAGARTDAVDGLLAAAAALASATAPRVIVRRRHSGRSRTDTLLDLSRSATLLVLGESRIDSDRAGFLGSVTHEVLLNLNSPVLVARTPIRPGRDHNLDYGTQQPETETAGG